MKRLRPLLALAAVPLFAVPSFAAPDPCAVAKPTVGACVRTPAVGVAQLGQLDGDSLRNDLCALLARTSHPAYLAVCNGSYTGSEICVILMNDYNLAPFDEDIAELCTPKEVAQLICKVTGFCGIGPVTDAAGIRTELPIG